MDKFTIGNIEFLGYPFLGCPTRISYLGTAKGSIRSWRAKESLTYLGPLGITRDCILSVIMHQGSVWFIMNSCGLLNFGSAKGYSNGITFGYDNVRQRNDLTQIRTTWDHRRSQAPGCQLVWSLNRLRVVTNKRFHSQQAKFPPTNGM